MANRQKRAGSGIGGSIVAIAMLLGFLAVVYFFVTSIFSILSFVAPFLLFVAILIKRQVVTDYMSMLLGKFKENAGIGLLWGIGSFVAFPLVAGYLFIKALIAHQLEKKFGPQEKVYDDYEVVEEEVEEEEDFLELPEIEKVKSTKSSNEYEDLF